VLAFLEDLLDRLGDLGPVALHLLAGGLAFAETAMFLDLLVPGEVGMVLVGAAARREDLPLGSLVAVGALGAALGDSVSYGLGRAVGAGRLPGSQWLVRRASRSVARAERYFERHGGRAVFLGRWVGALRAVVPFAAGLARMPYRRFLAWNIAASLGWVATVVGAGWFLGEAVAERVGDVSSAVSIVVVASLALLLVLRHRRRRRDRPAPASTVAS
jgi:membrane protein DedA with SNARE-associated domain